MEIRGLQMGNIYPVTYTMVNLEWSVGVRNRDSVEVSNIGLLFRDQFPAPGNAGQTVTILTRSIDPAGGGCSRQVGLEQVLEKKQVLKKRQPQLSAQSDALGDAGQLKLAGQIGLCQVPCPCAATEAEPGPSHQVR